MSTYLSDHFTLEELTRSSIATRHGIDNTPPSDVVDRLTLVCVGILEPLRKNFKIPFAPNSGYRCLELNTLIGSKSTSQHVKGEAVDIELPGISNGDLAMWIYNYVPFDQLILEHYKSGDPTSGWVHVSLKARGNRGIANTFDGRRFLTGLRI